LGFAVPGSRVEIWFLVFEPQARGKICQYAYLKRDVSEFADF